MRYKIWTGAGDTFGEVQDRIEVFLNAHPTIQIAETKIFQSMVEPTMPPSSIR